MKKVILAVDDEPETDTVCAEKRDGVRGTDRRQRRGSYLSGKGAAFGSHNSGCEYASDEWI